MEGNTGTEIVVRGEMEEDATAARTPSARTDNNRGISSSGNNIDRRGPWRINGNLGSEH